MGPRHIETAGVPIQAWTGGLPIAENALEQLERTARLPFLHSHLAVMPDVHWGLGATIGSVMATVGAVVPAAVGVDLGCGMCAMRTTLGAADLPDDLRGVRAAVERAVPHGRSAGRRERDRGAWGELPPRVACAWKERLEPGFRRLAERHREIASANHVHHLGTLGTGNHFVEVCLDEAERVWVMLHSGSRGVGHRIASVFIERAKRELEGRLGSLPDRDLAWLREESPSFHDYLEAVGWAQEFARTNRELMLESTLEALQRTPGIRPFRTAEVAIDCHHNYVAREVHFGRECLVTRKGAVRARRGDLGIVPGSMGAKSFIVRGRGNAASFHSCSHGAGRLMSRAAAARTFTLADHARATAGVECRKDARVLDETPGAYKPIEAVMKAQEDLVEVVHTLRQVVCVKG